MTFEEYNKQVEGPIVPSAPVSVAATDPSNMTWPTTNFGPPPPAIPPKEGLMSRIGSYIASPDFQVATGQLAQAVMGEHQDSWQAQMGRQVEANVQKTRYSTAAAKAAAGENFSSEDLKGLEPQQILSLTEIQDKKRKSSLDRYKMFSDLAIKLNELGVEKTLAEATLTRYANEFILGKEAIKIRREEIDANERITGAKIEADKYIEQQRNQNAMDRLRYQVEAEIGPPDANRFNKAYELALREVQIAGQSSGGTLDTAVADQILKTAFKRIYQQLADTNSPFWGTGTTESGSSWKDFLQVTPAPTTPEKEQPKVEPTKESSTKVSKPGIMDIPANNAKKYIDAVMQADQYITDKKRAIGY